MTLQSIIDAVVSRLGVTLLYDEEADLHSLMRSVLDEYQHKAGVVIHSMPSFDENRKAELPDNFLSFFNCHDAKMQFIDTQVDYANKVIYGGLGVERAAKPITFSYYAALVNWPLTAPLLPTVKVSLIEDLFRLYLERANTPRLARVYAQQGIDATQLRDPSAIEESINAAKERIADSRAELPMVAI